MPSTELSKSRIRLPVLRPALGRVRTDGSRTSPRSLPLDAIGRCKVPLSNPPRPSFDIGFVREARAILTQKSPRSTPYPEISANPALTRDRLLRDASTSQLSGQCTFPHGSFAWSRPPWTSDEVSRRAPSSTDVRQGGPDSARIMDPHGSPSGSRPLGISPRPRLPAHRAGTTARPTTLPREALPP